MGTAMAYAYKVEKRELNSQPEYRYATGTLTVKYLKPTSNNHLVELSTTVIEMKGRKTIMHCEVYSQGVKTAEAEVIAIRVFDGNQANTQNPFVE